MLEPWQPSEEEVVKLRAAVLKEHPELAADEAGLQSMIEQAIAFARKWEPHFFPSDESR